LKKIKLIFESIFCDFCSYDIEGILGSIPEVKNFEIHRKSNSVNIFLDEHSKFDKDKINKLFRKEDFKIIEILGG
jgi:hypothetical protein